MWSIYSLSHEGVSGRGIQGQRPAAAHTGVGRSVGVGCPEAWDGPDVRNTSDFRKFCSVTVAPVVRSVSVVRALGLVGRPAFVGRPATVALVAWSSSGRLGCVRYRMSGGVRTSGGYSL